MGMRLTVDGFVLELKKPGTVIVRDSDGRRCGRVSLMMNSTCSRRGSRPCPELVEVAAKAMAAVTADLSRWTGKASEVK